MNMLQGLISLGPLFSIVAAGSVFLQWFHRVRFEKGLVYKFKRVAEKKGVKLPFESDKEIAAYLRESLSFEKLIEEVVMEVKGKYSPRINGN